LLIRVYSMSFVAFEGIFSCSWRYILLLMKIYSMSFVAFEGIFSEVCGL
jgi:hypothetical protein